jgi:hypothetical protein
MIKIRRVTVIVAITAQALVACAGSIRLSVDGVLDPREWSSGQPIAVDLGPDPVQGVRTIHIWEDVQNNPNGPWTSTVGPLAIVGTIDPNSSTRINVLVAAADSSFPVLASEFPTTPGALAFGNDPAIPVITFSDPELQRRSVLVVNVREAIRGDITVGQIPFLQARNDVALTAVGDIESNVLAVAPNRLLSSTPNVGITTTAFNSIGTVRAGRSIQGSIRVNHPTMIGLLDVTGVGSRGGIDRVVVGPRFGPSSGVVGILADISTNIGNIGDILSTGSVGSEDDPVSISAGHNLRGVRTVTETGTLIPDANIFANIMVGTRAAFATFTDRDGQLESIQCSGNFKGSISAEVWFPRFETDGLRVRGDVDAPITINRFVREADLVARSFLKPIVIGIQLKGSIVAYGNDVPCASLCNNEPCNTDPSPSAGFIHSISIGNGTATSTTLDKGFIGARFQPPVDVSPYSAPGSPREAFDVWTSTSTIRNGSSADSIIAARHIGVIDIAAMSQFAGTNNIQDKSFMPRIEARQIDSLKIGEMRAGVVWSGALNWSGCGGSTPILLADDRADNYASIGALSIGCVSPAADVWFKDSTFAEIRGDLLGELHLPKLDSSQTIRIGGKLGQGIDTVDGVDTLGDAGCGSLINPPFLWRATEAPDFGPIENSPRGSITRVLADGTTSNAVLAKRGEIRIAAPGPLGGQIIIDANNTGPQRPETHWRGLVRRNTQPNDVESVNFLAFNESAPFNAPEYDLTPDQLGGGAVGLVPFTIHDLATWPPNPAPGNIPPQILLDSTFNAPGDPTPGSGRTVDIEMYGPVRASGMDDPVLIYFADLSNPTVFHGPINLPGNRLFNIAVRRAGNANTPSRTIMLSRSPNHHVVKGIYKVVPVRAPRPDFSVLFCDSLTLPTPVADFEYRFAIGGDCDADGTLDTLQLAAGGSAVDENDNDILDSCEHNQPTCAWLEASPRCPADFDGDGGVTGADIEAFFIAFEVGDSCGDTDQDGGITGADIEAFFNAFEAGGC